MRVLVVGGYGFIGRAVAETLVRRGHQVVGWGRSASLGRAILPDARWIEGDLRNADSEAFWREALVGIDAVINASGALQDGAGQNLHHIQGFAITRLIRACEATGIRHFVQISAVGAGNEATTRFLYSKSIADESLSESSLAWTIVRPALVIGRNAYGGTALIRALATLPFLVTVHGDSVVQCVALDDVAAVCAEAVEGVTSPRRDVTLAADERLTLRQVIAEHRRWLGLPPARVVLNLPPGLADPLVSAADFAFWLGWRSPLRSTAMRVMQDGVIAEANDGAGLAPLAQILAANPAGVQDRIAARLFLLLPLIVLALSALWIGSGIVGLAYAKSAATLIGGGNAAVDLVRACSVIDLLLGFAIMVRPWARATALLMALGSFLYLVGGSIVTPSLWSDPLAPLLKILPALGLALVAASLLDRR